MSNTDVAVANTNKATDTMLLMIERVAKDPTVDLDKCERLIALRNQEFERVAKEEFNIAMAKAQSEINPVVKDANNTFLNSKYAKYEAISKAMQPVIEKYNFAISFSEGKSEIDGHIKIIGTLACGAHEKIYEVNVPLDAAGLKGNDNKNKIQAFGSTITYARRYLKMMMFDIAVTDEDDDAQSVGQSVINDKQFRELQSLIDETGADIVNICYTYNIPALSHLPNNMFLAVKNVLTARRNKMKLKAKDSINANNS